MSEESNMESQDDAALEAEMAEATRAEAAAAEVTQTAPAEFGEFEDPGLGADPSALSLLYDLSMPVAIELGRTRMSVQDILALGRGSVIQLDRLAGEPIDVFVGDRRFAEGEVVVVGEQFGVRITRVLGTAGIPGGEALA
jgi:flagellar motor switch protein FliN